MPLILTQVEIDPRSIPELRTLKKIGGTRLRGTVKQKLVTITNKIAKLSANAYKSKVPVDTYELRDRYIKVLKRATQKSPMALVGVTDNIHRGRGRKKPASELADILNSGKGEKGHALHRSHTSDAIPPYRPISAGSTTAGWIQKARTAYRAQRKRFLSLSG